MSFDFNRVIDRTSSCSYKWNRYKDKDILPMWVADSDFQSPPELIDAIRDRLDHGVLGYTHPDEYDSGKDAVVEWLSLMHDWCVDPDWIVWMPGVVSGFHVACKAYCKPGDKVMVQTPNYTPILNAPQINQLKKLEIPSILEDGRWVLDLNVLEKNARDPDCKLLILCNPMNPCGSVLNEAELKVISEICGRHNVMVCSDEIHCDLILDKECLHIPAGSLPELAERSVTLMSAAKTFNIAGLSAAFAIIPDAKVRESYKRQAMGIVPWVNILGLIATEAAFRHGRYWYHAQIDYLRGNRNFLVESINGIDGLSMVSPEATFLAWINTAGLGVDNAHRLFEECGIGPSAGSDFGEPDFIRINFACPRIYLNTALDRLNIGLEL